MLQCIDNFEQLNQRFRTALINSVAGFKALNLVGTISESSQPNLAVFNSIFHVGANPPLLGMVFRPDSVDRHTLANIEATDVYTLNHVNKDIYKQAHQTSARYDVNINEFEATGLHEVYSHNCIAPMVQESEIRMTMKLEEVLRVQANGTIIIIGAIQQLYLPQSALGEDGFVDLENAGTITVAGLDAYYSANLLERLPYAKPNQ